MKRITIPVPEAALRELEELYKAVEKALDALGGVCRGDGACCRFGESGIRLYLTRLEKAMLLRDNDGSTLTPEQEDACPFLVGDRCTARNGRALGCRCYFCNPDLSEATAAIYESFHAAIRSLHDRQGIPYFYNELIYSLEMISSQGGH